MSSDQDKQEEMLQASGAGVKLPQGKAEPAQKEPTSMKEAPFQALRLGQAGKRVGEAVWLFIVFRDGQYLTWSEVENAEFRELMEIDPELTLPQIRIKRFHHPDRNAFVRKALQKYRRVGKLPPEVEQKVVRESVAYETLVDWRHIAFMDGTIEDYTPEAGTNAFKEDPDFYETVVSAGLNEEYHRATSLQENVDLLGEA